MILPGGVIGQLNCDFHYFQEHFIKRNVMNRLKEICEKGISISLQKKCSSFIFFERHSRVVHHHLLEYV